MSVKLIAMAPSGDVVIIQRENGELFQRMPEGSSGSGTVDGRHVAEAVGLHGFLRFDEEFETMKDLQRKVDRVVMEQPKRRMPTYELDVAAIRRFLPHLTGLASDMAKASSAGQRAVRYLKVPGVWDDPALRQRLLAIVDNGLSVNGPKVPHEQSNSQKQYQLAMH